MHTPHDLRTRPPAPRPSLLATDATRAAPVPPRFLDAVGPHRAVPSAGHGHPRLKPRWLVGGVALFAGSGAVLAMAWNALAWQEVQALAAAAPVAQAGVTVSPGPATVEAGAVGPARGAARIERLGRPDAPPVSAPVALAALGLAPVPDAGAAEAGKRAAGGGIHGPAQAPVRRPGQAAVMAGEAAARPGVPGPGAQVLASPVRPDPEVDAEAELLEAVMAWDQRHPPAASAARAPRPSQWP